MNFFNLLYPGKCPYCGKVIDNCLEACEDCYAKLPFNFEKRKIKILDKEILCVAPFEYKTYVKQAIINFKFFSKTSYATAFSNSLYKSFSINFINAHFDIITSIPLSKKSKKQRGFNQAELISKKLSKKLGIKYLNILEKCKENKPQHNLNLSERKENVKGIFRLKKKIDVSNKQILLIDDIITTGNTLAEATKVLLNNNAKSVSCLTLANTKK